MTESRIKGEFDGFDGDRIFELVSGEKWQQALYKYRYRHLFQPVVRVWHDAGNYYLEVEGMEERIRVHRIQ